MSSGRRPSVNQLLLLLIAAAIAIFIGINPTNGQNRTEILWDSWGVPHVFAKDDKGLFEAFGWAQAQSHGDLILRLYGQARGQAAQYWGASFLDSDRYVRTMGIPARAQQWYDAQNQQMRSYLDAFAQGINRYVQKNGDQIDDAVENVLPITGVDILAHLQRVIHFHFLFNPQRFAAFNAGKVANMASPDLGSNAWAIAPSYSASGKAMLLANPHLPWSDLFLLYEAQLTGAGIDTYGATLVGMPFLAIAFNNVLGWTITVNPLDGADVYELTLADEGYLWEGKVRPFQTETQTLKIKGADGTLIEQPLVIQNSLHGPIIGRREDKAFALRVVGLDRPGILEQFWQMAQATNQKQFEAALVHLQLPLFNVLYADRNGQVLYLFNGQIPVRSQGDWNYWQGVIPGNTKETLWTEYHSYQDLPRLSNPSTGWLQNANDPPWTSTFPRELEAQNYPAYFAPSALGKTSNIFRPQRSIALLKNSQPLSFEQMIAHKFSSRLELADRLLDELIPAAQLLANPIGIAAAEVLAAWDRQTNANSKGAVLFSLWALSLEPSGLFSTPWNNDSPLTTPNGLADINTAIAVLEGVAAQVELLYGSLEVSWGEVVRLQYGDQNLAASGGPGLLGSFRVLDAVPSDGAKFRVVAGDSYIAAIEFSDPINAQVLTVYGNATQPQSSHVGDQLSLYASQKLRPVWRTRQEVEAHLESRQVF